MRHLLPVESSLPTGASPTESMNSNQNSLLFCEVVAIQLLIPTGASPTEIWDEGMCGTMSPTGWICGEPGYREGQRPGHLSSSFGKLPGRWPWPDDRSRLVHNNNAFGPGRMIAIDASRYEQSAFRFNVLLFANPARCATRGFVVKRLWRWEPRSTTSATSRSTRRPVCR